MENKLSRFSNIEDRRVVNLVILGWGFYFRETIVDEFGDENVYVNTVRDRERALIYLTSLIGE